MIYFIIYGEWSASDMLDDLRVIDQRDSSGALAAAGSIVQQLSFDPLAEGEPGSLEISNIIISGIGGSALAADIIKAVVRNGLNIPLEVVKSYELPGYVGRNTLVVAVSRSGNTEEILSCYVQAMQAGAIVVVAAGGGELLRLANRDGVPRVTIPVDAQPRFAMGYQLKALSKILQIYSVIGDGLSKELAGARDWLAHWVHEWRPERPLEHNYAKQLAEKTVGKTPIFYGGELTGPVAYRWKVSWNETAKNVAFYGLYPEVSHGEFIGWLSHPIDKPFAIFDILSSFERSRITESMELSDKMLSGKRPKSTVITLQGDSLVQQLLWGMLLADMTSIYGAILNGVDPMRVESIERFKKSLS